MSDHVHDWKLERRKDGAWRNRCRICRATKGLTSKQLRKMARKKQT